MLFRSRLVDAAWDTWMYCADGKYYLYYLITETSPGEGFGVAISEDGVHFKDYGKQIEPSDKMTFYLGTGSVWKPIFQEKGYLCNYSEWRLYGDEKRQQIFFAWSDDLIHWKKYGDSYAFDIDTRYYTKLESEQSRWDCINTLRVADGYIGCWTARPYAHAGIGLGKSEDGLHWRALPPPDMDISIFDGHEIESGSITFHQGRYYMLVGCYDSPRGVVVMVSYDPAGKYVPQAESAALFTNEEFMHGYFARFFETPEGTLANFHVLLREQNQHMRHYTYMAPIKKVHYDEEGILRLRWWQANDGLIGPVLDTVQPACMARLNVSDGEKVQIHLQNGDKYLLSINADGRAELMRNGKTCARIDRGLKLEGCMQVKILLRDTMLEWYLDEWYMFCYTLPAAVVDIQYPGHPITFHALNFE